MAEAEAESALHSDVSAVSCDAFPVFLIKTELNEEKQTLENQVGQWIDLIVKVFLMPLKSNKDKCASGTCDLVSNQFAGFNLADAAKQTAELFLGHVLGQVVDNQIGLAVIICWAGLHG